MPVVAPFQKIEEGSSTADGALLRNETPDQFLWLLSPPWDGVQTRQQHFARRMARLGKEVLYVETDDYVLYARHAGERRRTIERERNLLVKADTVFVTASELLKKPSLQSARPVLLPNGVDYELFAAASQPGPINSLVANLKKP